MSTAPRAALAMDVIVSWAKRRGFVWAASELYGSIGSGYDYGPLGSQLKKNVTNAWWRDFVEHRGDCVSMESSVILNPKVWEASGHVSQFVDPLAECTKCKRRLRADKAVDAALGGLSTPPPEWLAGGMKTLTSLEDLGRALEALGVTCPGCGSRALGPPRHFNLLFQTHVGPLGGDGTPAYLRPETAQGAYVHFLNLLNSTRRRLPFGVGQVGKSFRNEIATGNFLFRTREFDQAELQYFVPPQDSPGAHRKWVDFSEGWLTGVAGLRPGSVRLNEYAPGELAHYALATTDIMFKYPFGWEELMGIANRGDYDLKAHSKAAKLQLAYTNPDTPGETFFPHVVEPALGINRLLLAMFCDGLREEEVSPGDNRLVFHCAEDLAPTQLLVLPLVKKAEQMGMAKSLWESLLPLSRAGFDSAGSIGKRYRRGDEDGVPLCATIDHDSPKDNSITLRDRDTMAQVRVPVQQVLAMAKAGNLKPSAFPEFARKKEGGL